MVLLATSEENGMAFVETANLDGERNLKSKNVVHDSLRLRPEQFESLRGGYFQVDQPNMNLHEFSGSSHLQGVPVQPLG